MMFVLLTLALVLFSQDVAGCSIGGLWISDVGIAFNSRDNKVGHCSLRADVSLVPLRLLGRVAVVIDVPV